MPQPSATRDVPQDGVGWWLDVEDVLTGVPTRQEVTAVSPWGPSPPGTEGQRRRFAAQPEAGAQRGWDEGAFPTPLTFGILRFANAFSF